MCHSLLVSVRHTRLSLHVRPCFGDWGGEGGGWLLCGHFPITRCEHDVSFGEGRHWNKVINVTDLEETGVTAKSGILLVTS